MLRKRSARSYKKVGGYGGRGRIFADMTFQPSCFTRFTPTLTLLLLSSAFAACGGSVGTTEGAGTVSGIAYNIERVSLPPRCTLTVDLLDSALVNDLDNENRLLGRQVQDLVEARVPLGFTVRYNPQRVDTLKHRYLLDVRIARPDGSLAFRNNLRSGGVVPGRPDSVEIVLRRIYDDE